MPTKGHMPAFPLVDRLPADLLHFGNIIRRIGNFNAQCRVLHEGVGRPQLKAWLHVQIFSSEAKAALVDLLKLKPDLTAKGYRDTAAMFSDNPVSTQQIARMAEGLRKAGLPEQ
jgi:hypothetical protein